MKIEKMAKNLILKNGTIMDPFHGKTISGDIWLKDGKIAGVGKVYAPKDSLTIDCSGKVITHGFCDIHVHFREPGREDKETLDSGSMAALAGGFTRVCVMPNTDPPLDSPESIRYTIDRGEECPIHIHPIGAITKSQDGKELTEMGAMLSEGAVAFSDDGLPVTDTGMMRNALEYATMFDVPIINHAEDLCLKKDGVMHEGKISTQLGLPASPGITESNMVHRDLELTELTGARLHVPHVSSAKSTDYIRQMKKSNNKITAEVTPHHLFFTDDDLITYNTDLKVAPPIRTQADQKALIKGVKDGTFDCIATDHAPHTWKEKQLAYDQSPAGLPLVQHALLTLLDHVKYKRLTIEQVVDKVAHNPARRYGIINRGFIREGYYADLVLVNVNQSTQASHESSLYHCGWTPFHGHRFSSKIESTWVNGQQVFDGINVINNPHWGERLLFNKS